MVRLTSNNSKPDPVIQKIKLSKEEQDEVNKILKGEPVKRTRIAYNRRGYSYEVVSNKPLTQEVARKRLVELYGGKCSCGNWPDYKVMRNHGDKQQGAWLVSRYCQSCFEKQPIPNTYNKHHKKGFKK